ncbi:unnamed protein product [Adineta steineri]|uniref:Uncharacterized protein n=2 Tax=Adineta steineri TaxID=433720 RepID=A0A815CQF4_9BILA|nr:unnamed protein product [Adineta steineri]
MLFIFLALIIIIFGLVLDKYQLSPIVLPILFLNTATTSTTSTTSTTATTTTTTAAIIFRPYPLTNQDCKSYDFKRLRRPNMSHVTLPIYDYFIFHDELDTLEIRLYELYNYVTLFLIAESQTTLTGKSKPLYLKENWQKFEKYHDKMRRIEVELDEDPRGQWTNEIKMRRDGLLLALKNQTQDILLLTSDVDEIPKAHFLYLLNACELPKPFPSLVLVCAYYYYSFEFRRQGGAIDGPTVSFLAGNRTNRTTSPDGKYVRDERFSYQPMPSACYHCSWCFDRINLTRSKLASFSHSELNRAEYHTQEHIIDRYRHGKDLFNRPSEIYIRIENNDEIPELIKAQPERFSYLINRAALVNAGFRDVTQTNSSEKQR